MAGMSRGGISPCDGTVFLAAFPDDQVGDQTGDDGDDCDPTDCTAYDCAKIVPATAVAGCSAGFGGAAG